MTESNFAGCMTMLAKGDMQGLKQVYEDYGQMIYSTALGLCRNSHLAEDITSEFFLRLKNAAHVYRTGMGHKKWLLVSARNLALDIIRRQSREIPSSESDENNAFSELADIGNTEESVSSDMTVQQMLELLSTEQREIVYLKIYCELTLAEISDVLQIPIGTAAWRYRTAIKKLEKLYGEVLR